MKTLIRRRVLRRLIRVFTVCSRLLFIYLFVYLFICYLFIYLFIVVFLRNRREMGEKIKKRVMDQNYILTVTIQLLSSEECAFVTYVDCEGPDKTASVQCNQGLHCRFYITKTCLYNINPLKPHFYIAKLGFTGVNIIFLISAQNKDCGYSLKPPRRGGSNEYPTIYVLSRNVKNIRAFYLKIFSFWR